MGYDPQDWSCLIRIICIRHVCIYIVFILLSWIYIYIYICIYIYIYMCTYIYIYTYYCICIYIYILYLYSNFPTTHFWEVKHVDKWQMSPLDLLRPWIVPIDRGTVDEWRKPGDGMGPQNEVLDLNGHGFNGDANNNIIQYVYNIYIYTVLSYINIYIYIYSIII